MKGVLVLQATVHDLNGINMIQGVRMGGRSQRLHSVRVHLTPLLLVCGETECMSVAYGGFTTAHSLWAGSREGKSRGRV